MISVKELQRWLNTLPPGDSVAVDEGGLALVQICELSGEVGDAYLEVGGVPEDNSDIDDDEWRVREERGVPW